MKSTVKISRKLVLIILFAISAGVSAADSTDYRLTGIIGSSTGTAFAVIETADGQQRLLKEGSAIGAGRVKQISNYRTVVLALPEGELALHLTGSGNPADSATAFSIEDFYGETTSQALDQATLSSLSELAEKAAKLSDAELSVQLNELLGLSAQAQIDGYDDKKADSARSVIQQLNNRLSNMMKQEVFLGTLAVSDQYGRRRVYLAIAEEARQ